MTQPEQIPEPAEIEYRARQAQRRQLIAAGLFFLFAGLPALTYLIVYTFS